MSLILSIDVGTTNAKAGVVDERGRLLSISRRELKIKKTSSGAAEQSPDEVRNALLCVAAEAARGFGESIKLISPSSYQMAMYLEDKSGKPLSGISTLLDTRAAATFPEFLTRVDADKLYHDSGSPCFSQSPAARLFWYKKKEPGILSKIARVFSGKAFLLRELCGEFVSDPSTDAASQLLKVDAPDWLDYILEVIGIDSRALPVLCEAKSRSFRVLPFFADQAGLSRDVEVIPGLYDSGGLILGMGGYCGGCAVSNIGTSGMLRVVCDRPVTDSSPRRRLQTYRLFNDMYVTGAAINNGTAPFAWAKENFGVSTFEEIDDLIKASAPGAGGVCCLPYLSGEREPSWGHIASGAFLGLRSSNTRADLFRAIAESVACTLGLIGEAIRENGIPFSQVRFGGGGYRLRELSKMVGAALGVEMVSAEAEEPALVGNAMLGYVFTGVYNSLETAGKNMLSYRDSLPVDSGLKVFFEKKISQYRKLREVMPEIYSLMGGDL